MRDKILIFLLILTVILLSVQIFIPRTIESKSYIDYELEKNKINYTEDTNCQSNDLLYSAFCLRKELLTFYNYTINNTSKLLNLDELKTLGGVCSHYSNWYNQNMQSLGFYSQTVTIQTNSSIHEFTLSWDEHFNHICILDQGVIVCR